MYGSLEQSAHAGTPLLALCCWLRCLRGGFHCAPVSALYLGADHGLGLIEGVVILRSNYDAPIRWRAAALVVAMGVFGVACALPESQQSIESDKRGTVELEKEPKPSGTDAVFDLGIEVPELPGLGPLEDYLPGVGCPEEPMWVLPAKGTFTSGFGWRWERMHNGIDIAAPTGTPVYPVNDGIVVSAGFVPGFGNTVVVHHPCGGYATLYAHCHELKVVAGDLVDWYGPLCSMGSTGRSTGPHVHFEVGMLGHTGLLVAQEDPARRFPTLKKTGQEVLRDVPSS